MLTDDVVCPFCGEGDFDLVGLKMHFLRGWCDKFNETSLDVPRTREANAALTGGVAVPSNGVVGGKVDR